MSEKSLVHDCKDEGIDCMDGEPTREHVSTKEPWKAAWYDYLYVAYSIVVYIADVVTDMLVSVKYFRNGDYVWFSLTLSCVFGASFVMMLFSLKWYYDDTAKEVSKTKIVVLHVLQIGPLIRYWECCKHGKQSRKKDADIKYYNIYVENWRDITMLRLFEVFIESAPQLVLQLYILAYNRHFDKGKDWLTVLSACFSLLSLATSIVSYSKALRDASNNKGKMTWWAFAFQIVWRLSMVASRIVTLVLFASVYKSWILLLIGLHWVAMTIWIRWLKPSFCPDNEAVRFIYSAVIGFIYVFCFFNVKDGFTRKRLVFFYTLMFVENCALMGAWLPYRHEYGGVFVASLAMVFGGFFIGVLALILYYQCYHPSLETQGICVRTTHNVPHQEGIVYRMVCCNTCCPVQSYEDEESSPPRGRQLDVDIPASRGSLRHYVTDARNSAASPKFESEILIHRPSELQKQYSLEKDKIKKKKAERARRRHSMESSVRNGAANSVVVQVPNNVHSKGARSLPNSPSKDIEMNELRNSEVKNKNGNVCSVDIHVANLTLVSRGNDSDYSKSPDFHENIQFTVSDTSAFADPEVELPHHVDLNQNASLVTVNDRHGLMTSNTPDNRVHNVTSGNRNARKPCDDGVHCATDYEKEVKTSRTTCDDGLHCGTDDGQDTKTSKPDVTPSHLGNIKDIQGNSVEMVPSKTNINIELRTGDHVNGACAATDSHVQNMRPTQLPKYSDRVNFQHRYSFVPGCISSSSSTSSENEEDRLMEEKATLNDPSCSIYKGVGANIEGKTVDGNSNIEEELLDQAECSTPSNSLEHTQMNATSSLTRSVVTRRHPNHRTINRRSKQSNRVSFPNFVATNLKRGRFSSLRRSDENCTKGGDNIRRHTVDFSVLPRDEDKMTVPVLD